VRKESKPPPKNPNPTSASASIFGPHTARKIDAEGRGGVGVLGRGLPDPPHKLGLNDFPPF